MRRKKITRGRIEKSAPALREVPCGAERPVSDLYRTTSFMVTVLPFVKTRTI